MKIKKFIELSKWFHRTSQHYIMGNWYEYEKIKFPRKEHVKTFERGYLKAYIKFMWLSRKDYM